MAPPSGAPQVLTRSRFVLAGLALVASACGDKGDEAPLPDDTATTDQDGDGLSGEEDCDDGDPLVGAPTEWWVDADADGWGAGAASLDCEAPSGSVARDGDCDDADPDSHPEATERCGGGDEDCDGSTDEDDAIDAEEWYLDSDGDGHGDPTQTTRACLAPDGYVDNATDCEDTDPLISPDGTESCNELDDDCDGEIDEEAIDAPTWYADVDGDGEGDPDSVQEACLQPSGHVATALDCDDGDAAIHPGAAESCDGVDEDCDGDIDEEAVDALAWYADVDGDGAGDPAARVDACDAPSGTVADDGDCDDSDPTILPGATETCDEVDQDCDGLVDEGATDATTWYVDADSDGYGESTTTTDACEAPTGYVALDGDCDDADATINPGATETWYDGVDSDCDGGSDCDADGDGFDAEACGGDDCDDGDPTTFPGSGTWSVPGDFATIQDAIDAACDLDRIEVDAGTWTETIDYGSKALVIVGEGADSTILDGDSSGDPVVTMLAGTLEAFTITNGLATDGGGIYVSGGEGVSLVDLVVSANTATDTGGGLYLTGTDLVLSGVEVRGNLADQGGGIYASVDSSGSLIGADVEISGNEASSSGGGLYLLADAGAAADLSGVEIHGNTAAQKGGAYLFASGSSAAIDLSGATISDNLCDNQYAGIYAYAYGTGATIDLAGATLSRNDSAGSYGGGHLRAAGSSALVSFTDGEIWGNGSDSYSGGIYVYSVSSSSIDLSGTAIRHNLAEYYGGLGATLSSGSLDLTGVQISNNSASTYYGGIYATMSSSSTFLLSGAEVVDNSDSSSSTGAVQLIFSASTATVEDSLIAGNSGLGLHATASGTSGTFDMTNSTVVGNGAGGLRFSPNSSKEVVLLNVNIAHNAGYGISDANTTYDPSMSYCNAYGNDSGAYSGMTSVTGKNGNVAVDPIFLAFHEDGSPALWDLHLAAASTLFDAGDPAILDGDGTASDIGAYTGADYYADADADGLYDGWEEIYGLDTSTDDSAEDPDADGLTNAEEFDLGTDPSRADTDGDLVDDGDEDAAGTEPLVFEGEGAWASSWTGASISVRAGYSLALAGDVDGDGEEDLLVGAGSGALWLLSGPLSGSGEVSSLATASFTGSSYLGLSPVGAADLDGDGYDDVATSDWTASGNAGAIYVFPGPLSGSLAVSTDPEGTWTGESKNDYGGFSLASVGDVDGDGLADLLVGAYGQSSATGVAYLLAGPATGSHGLSEARAILSGGATSDGAGYDVAGPGDTYGDGFADLLVGALGEDEDGTGGGAAWLVPGPVTGSQTLASVGLRIGGRVGAAVGIAVGGAGDVDADGDADLLVVASGRQGQGEITLFLGPLTADVALDEADGTWLGERAGDGAGLYRGLSTAGDVDADGMDDILVGAADADGDTGAAWLLLGPATGVHSLAEADLRLYGENSGDRFGMAVAGGADLDGDGWVDLLFGADLNDDAAYRTGKVSLVSGATIPW